MQCAVRLKKELSMLAVDPPAGVSCGPHGDDINHLWATLTGPDDSPFERGTFTLDVVIPKRYPFEPPQMTFCTPLYHPNVDGAGRICLDALKMPPTGSWRPSLRLASLLMSIRLLMAQPNPDDPLMPAVANEYRLHREKYEQKAAEMTAQHAIPKAEFGPAEGASQSGSVPSDHAAACRRNHADGAAPSGKRAHQTTATDAKSCGAADKRARPGGPAGSGL